jgi:hypothetical protein
MNEIHCHTCGGFIGDRALIAYQLPLDPGGVAEPHSALCTCSRPMLYGAPPGHASSPGMPRVDRASL